MYACMHGYMAMLLDLAEPPLSARVQFITKNLHDHDYLSYASSGGSRSRSWGIYSRRTYHTLGFVSTFAGHTVLGIYRPPFSIVWKVGQVNRA